MKFLIFPGTIYLFAHSLVKYTNDDSHIKKVGISPQLTFVATVDGKSYYADTSTVRNWTTALAFCKGIGMRLASITSAAQFEALNTANIIGFQFGAYWLSGRDARAVRQFSWHETQEELSETFYPFYYFHDTLLTCVCFDKSFLAYSTLASIPCYTTRLVLCEI